MNRFCKARFNFILFYIAANKMYFYSSIAQSCMRLIRYRVARSEMDGVCFSSALNEC